MIEEINRLTVENHYLKTELDKKKTQMAIMGIE